MAYQANALLEIALGETGYLEKRSLSQLDDPSANAGSGNYTKYARDLYTAGYYNGSKQGVSWCSVFVDWCHFMAAGKNKALAQKCTCQSGVYGASCTYSMQYYKSAGRFFTADPQPGDQIYFGTGNSATHTGIVYQADDQRVYTVEGNTSAQSGVVSNGGGVFRKSYPINHARILGYGRPLFSDEMPGKEKKPFPLDLYVTVRGDRSPTVRALQLLLIGNGCTCGSWGADGSFGAATEMAVRNYQKQNHLQLDGMAGPETWGSLLGVIS